MYAMRTFTYHIVLSGTSLQTLWRTYCLYPEDGGSMFRRNIITIDQTTRCHNTEGINMYLHLKSETPITSSFSEMCQPRCVYE